MEITMIKNLICMLMIFMLSGCSFFQIRRPIIEQGNVITNESVSRLHTGMSPAAVAEVMGTPVLSNILTPNRMEYIYTYQDRTNPRIVKRVSLIFSNGSLVRIEKG
jgi:outer membrane protein assembly factor BamE